MNDSRYGSVCAVPVAHMLHGRNSTVGGATKGEASLAFGRPVTQAVLTSFRAFVASDLKSQISNLEIPFRNRAATAGGT